MISQKYNLSIDAVRNEFILATGLSFFACELLKIIQRFTILAQSGGYIDENNERWAYNRRIDWLGFMPYLNLFKLDRLFKELVDTDFLFKKYFRPQDRMKSYRPNQNFIEEALDRYREEELGLTKCETTLANSRNYLSASADPIYKEQKDLQIQSPIRGDRTEKDLPPIKKEEDRTIFSEEIDEQIELENALEENPLSQEEEQAEIRKAIADIFEEPEDLEASSLGTPALEEKEDFSATAIAEEKNTDNELLAEHALSRAEMGLNLLATQFGIHDIEIVEEEGLESEIEGQEKETQGNRVFVEEREKGRMIDSQESLENKKEKSNGVSQDTIKPTSKPKSKIDPRLKERFVRANVDINEQLVSAIAEHHSSQVEKAFLMLRDYCSSTDPISRRCYFLKTMKSAPVEIDHTAGYEEIVRKAIAENEAWEEERETSEYQDAANKWFAKGRDAIAQIQQRLKDQKERRKKEREEE